MIPLKDNIPSSTFSFVNYLIIIANILVFAFEVSLASQEKAFIYNLGLIPSHFNNLPVFLNKPALLISLFTHMFLHGSFWHLLSNLLFLYIFGDNVEDYLGHIRYLLFYLLCGLFAAFFHIYQVTNSTLPLIGASGAIAGVMGAYFILYPQSRVLTLIPIFFFLKFIEIPAFFFLLLWFFIQFYSGILSFNFETGIAWWGHVGGFLSGIIFLFFLKPKKKTRKPAF